jgi:cytochrome c-type biogenesis protein CcmE
MKQRDKQKLIKLIWILIILAMAIGMMLPFWR